MTNRLKDKVALIVGSARGIISRDWCALHVAAPLVATRDEIDRMVAIAEGEFER